MDSWKSTKEQLDGAQEAGVSTTGIIDKALALAESGDFSVLLDEAFTAAVKAIRKQDNGFYLLKIKPHIKALKGSPVTPSDMDKLTEPPKKAKQRYTEKEPGSDDGTQQRQGKADLFIEMVRKWATIFSDESGKAYATFTAGSLDEATGQEVGTHRETWALDSRQFRAKASREFYRLFGTVAGEAAMKEGMEIVSADSDGTEKQAVYLRYAPMPGETGVYVDLGNDLWEVVEVTPKGWRIIQGSDCKVKFRRVQHSKPLPTPEPGGNVDDLWKHVNIAGQGNRLIVLAWLLEAMRTETPFPVLELIAGQGSAKSTTQERLRALIDPNAVMLRIEPRSNQDLSVSAISNHVISLNNLSHLSTTQQDFMCSMSTGGGDAARRLYTTDDEAAWDTKRPIIMNGINQLVTRPDLADRTICMELQRVEYKDEATLKAAWGSDYPRLLGALYSLLVDTLGELPKVKIGKLPRMGDFAKLGVAMVRALRLDVDFVDVFNKNRDEVVSRGVDASPVALALVDRVRSRGAYEGNAADLLFALEEFQPKHFDKAAWPKSPRGLGEMLRRLAPSLLVHGVEVETLPRDKSGNRYRISKIDKQSDTIETVI